MKKFLMLIFFVGLVSTMFGQTQKEIDKAIKKVDTYYNELDDYTIISISQNYMKSWGGGIKFSRFDDGGTYVNFSYPSPGIYTGEGVLIKFSDGTNMKFPTANVDYHLINGMFIHTTSCRLTQEQIKVLKEKDIIYVKMYIFKFNIKKPNRLKVNLKVLDEGLY